MDSVYIKERILPEMDLSLRETLASRMLCATTSMQFEALKRIVSGNDQSSTNVIIIFIMCASVTMRVCVCVRA